MRLRQWFIRERLALPDFKANAEKDALVNEYEMLQRESVGITLDRDGFFDEQVDIIKNRRQALEGELHEYLAPYAELTQKPQGKLESLRWETAQSIHKKGRYQNSSWENWDRREQKYRASR